MEPYNGEILPHWRFKTEPIARESSKKIYTMFLFYRKQDGPSINDRNLESGIILAGN